MPCQWRPDALTGTGLVGRRPTWLHRARHHQAAQHTTKLAPALTSALTNVYDVLALLEYFSSSTTTTHAAAVRVTPLDQSVLKTEGKAIFPQFLTNSNLDLRRTPVTLE